MSFFQLIFFVLAALWAGFITAMSASQKLNERRPTSSTFLDSPVTVDSEPLDTLTMLYRSPGDADIRYFAAS